ncbi:unnamed protein product [Polarella glacialis]|uniref:Phytanoyl-CoA dioxygenase n=1 Tax=Polarella glacialis TaxID=89957 RepID=A0A813E723_POLGL|nr:unnamed protein product [Polarella glacialis]
MRAFLAMLHRPWRKVTHLEADAKDGAGSVHSAASLDSEVGCLDRLKDLLPTSASVEHSCRSFLAELRPAFRPIASDIYCADTGWEELAAASLLHNGYCVLRAVDGGLVNPALCKVLRGRSASLLDEMLARTRNCDIDAAQDAVHFREFWSRSPEEQRYDMLVIDGALETDAEVWHSMFGLVDSWARPVLLAAGLDSKFNADKDNSRVDGVGCVVSLPGSPEQPFHVDGEEPGMVNAFLPLVRTTATNGPTELQPGSHLDRYRRSLCVAPELDAGNLLLFDWRLVHRGCANRSGAQRPVGYVTYVPAGATGAGYKNGVMSIYDIAYKSDEQEQQHQNDLDCQENCQQS